MKQAIISVYDKSGIIEFAKGLVSLNYSIISTGGTANLLMENSIPVREISEITGFREILEGRVKTIHPYIASMILAKRANERHMEEIKRMGISPIDLVVVNLYPFEKIAAGKIELDEELLENIDIGGVILLRAASKNFQDVLVVCDPNDYSFVLETIKNNKNDYGFRKTMAAKALRYTAYYDSVISSYFTSEPFPEIMTIPLKRANTLRYGENPHQSAAIYIIKDRDSNIMNLFSNMKIHQGKELSYNNYLDISSAYGLSCEFDEPCCVIVKHTNPCGVAISEDAYSAYKVALECDPVSAFGGIVAFNREVNIQTTEEIMKIFTECVVAPTYTAEALELFKTKPNIRVIELPFRNLKYRLYRSEYDFLLLQESNDKLYENLEIVTTRKPTEDELEELIFAWKICKHVKSNAIVLSSNKRTVGIGAGQMSRIDSLRVAVTKMNQSKLKIDGPIVLASDAFFPFSDVVEEAAKVGISAIIQPGGSVRDEETIEICNKHNIAMVFTGVRHFKH